MKKIGVLTFHRSINYGAFMQCFALSHRLQQRFPDCKVEVIDYESRIMHEHYIPKFSLSYIKHPKLFSQTKKKYTAFQSVLKFLPLSDKTFISDGDDEALYEYIKANYDAVVVGSDAVWNWIKRGFPNPYLLAKPDGIKKLSYAASAYGMMPESISPEQKEYFGRALDGFDFIGVRDEYTGSLVREIHGDENLQFTCDPTVLLDLEYVASLLGTDYASYIASVKKKYALPEDKILVGVMDSNADAASAIKEKYGEKVYTVALYVYNSAADKFISDINPLEWSLIFGAFDVTVTNYFHGTHLSLKNKTPVIAIDRTEFSTRNEGKIHDVLRRAGLLDCYFDGKSPKQDITAKFDSIIEDKEAYVKRIEEGFDTLAGSSESFFECIGRLL